MSSTLPELNAASSADFVRLVGPLFEHSPWVAERAVSQRPFTSAESLHAALCQIVAEAGTDEQMALIRAHPDLVGRLVLTAESRGEQAAAGLTDLSPDEVALFEQSNRDYQARFGFPFIICARLNKKDAILAAFPRRLQNCPEEERATALAEIYKIAHLRLMDLLAAKRGKLSTHVLNLVTGQPAAGMTIELRSTDAGELLKTVVTNRDGRTDDLLLEADAIKVGGYELTFFVGDFFQDRRFLDRVPVRFQITDETAGYHVPLLCTPWAYSTYRGS